MKTDRRSSGNAALDRLLGGGLELRTLTQIYGGPASGKSTLCTVAAVSCLRAGGSVIFIDSEGFSIERFRQVAGSDTETIADRLFLFEPVDFEQQGSMIVEADKVFKQHKPGLLILDSATALYRTDLEKGRDAMQMLTRQMLQLLGYAKRYEPGSSHHQPGLHGHHEKYVCRPWRDLARTHIEGHHPAGPARGARVAAGDARQAPVPS